MKKNIWMAVDLTVSYFATQILASILMMFGVLIWRVSIGVRLEGFADGFASSSPMVTSAWLLGMVLMVVYLWLRGYMKKEDAVAPASARNIAYTLLAGVGLIYLEDWFIYTFDVVDNLEQNFEFLLSSWTGILTVSLFGPIFEEILFRGVITKALLKQCRPAWAIFFSALIFGVVHMNPVQIVGAGATGALFAYAYYVTGSLWPGIILHIFNNSLAVWLGKAYPELESLTEYADPAFWGFISALALAKGVQVLYKYKQQHSAENQVIVEATDDNAVNENRDNETNEPNTNI